MKTTLMIIALSFALTLVASCGGGYTSGTVQSAEESFLKFTGNTIGVTISVDAGTPFPYSKETDLYKLKPGSHAVKVYRGAQLVVDRQLVLDNHVTFEIDVP